MSWRDDLSADELREIFDRDIAPTLTAGGAAELHPSVVFVGAQPGAGKSRAIADVHGEQPAAVPVIGDDLVFDDFVFGADARHFGEIANNLRRTGNFNPVLKAN